MPSDDWMANLRRMLQAQEAMRQATQYRSVSQELQETVKALQVAKEYASTRDLAATALPYPYWRDHLLEISQGFSAVTEEILRIQRGSPGTSLAEAALETARLLSSRYGFTRDLVSEASRNAAEILRFNSEIRATTGLGGLRLDTALLESMKSGQSPARALDAHLESIERAEDPHERGEGLVHLVEWVVRFVRTLPESPTAFALALAMVQVLLAIYLFNLADSRNEAALQALGDRLELGFAELTDKVDRLQPDTLSRGGITTANVSLRAGPGSDYDRRGVIVPNTLVEITGEEGGWYSIAFFDFSTGQQQDGWVSKRYLTVIEFVPTPTAGQEGPPPGTGSGGPGR